MTAFSTASANDTDWQPFEIGGAEQGEKNVLHAGEDGYFACFWRVGPDDSGEFDSTARMTTTVYAIEGKVEVTDADGGPVATLGAGDALTVPAGHVSHWKVIERPYKEIFVVGG
jgi:uncharacterized cupin superfamily protein